jgi:hypothetical protein
LNIAAALRQEHGLLRAASMFLVRALARLTGATVLVCMHKPVGEVANCGGRLLRRDEVERAAQDPMLDLPSAFVAASGQSSCYGVVIDQQVRCYAWTSPEPVRAVPGTMVTMPSSAAYVFKAFTDPSFRRQGLLRECLKAIEQGAARDRRTEVTALVEIHNRSSLRAFGSAGFERCGMVFVLKRPFIAKRVGCRCATPCTWDRDPELTTASSLRAAAEALARQSH